MSSLVKMDLAFELFRLVQFGEDASFGWQNWNPLFNEARILHLTEMIIRVTISLPIQ